MAINPAGRIMNSSNGAAMRRSPLSSASATRARRKNVRGAQPHRNKPRPRGDMFSPARRSEIMSHIRGRDTKPERLVRSHLHALGLRFRLHRRDLPGRPDIVLPRYKLAVFVHGCYWHLHQGCPAGRLPNTNQRFWKRKLESNRTRDLANLRKLRRRGWHVLVLWECDIERRPHLIARRIARALASSGSVT